MSRMNALSAVSEEIAWLDRLRVKLEPHVDDAVATLVHLSKHSSRDSVRAQAASKIVGLYAQCAADSAKLKMHSEPDADEADKVRVVVVTNEQLAETSKALAADYQARRLAAKQDVS